MIVKTSGSFAALVSRRVGAARGLIPSQVTGGHTGHNASQCRNVSIMCLVHGAACCCVLPAND